MDLAAANPASATPRPFVKPPIEVRRIDVRIDDDGPMFWLDGRPGATALAHALSAVFPDGERFFIDAVRHYKDRIDDPALRRQVAAFVGQEAQHGHIHERYNAAAERRGFRVSRVTARAVENTKRIAAELPPIRQLAITCALEHFTAMMAEQLLADEIFAKGVPEPHASIWRWHAVEEAEHKAVAFDVYVAVGGSYGRRVGAYLITSVMFGITTFLNTLELMHHNGTLKDPRAVADLLDFLFLRPGLVPRILPGWFDYLRPDFHPWDRDDREVIDTWKAKWAPKYTTLRTDQA